MSALLSFDRKTSEYYRIIDFSFLGGTINQSTVVWGGTGGIRRGTEGGG